MRLRVLRTQFQQLVNLPLSFRRRSEMSLQHHPLQPHFELIRMLFDAALQLLPRLGHDPLSQRIAAFRSSGRCSVVCQPGRCQQHVHRIRIELASLLQIGQRRVTRSELRLKTTARQPRDRRRSETRDHVVQKFSPTLRSLQLGLTQPRQPSIRVQQIGRVFQRGLIRFDRRVELGQFLKAATRLVVQLAVGRIRLPQHSHMCQCVRNTPRLHRDLNLPPTNLLASRIGSQHVLVNHEHLPSLPRPRVRFIEQQSVVGQRTDISRHQADVAREIVASRVQVAVPLSLVA